METILVLNQSLRLMPDVFRPSGFHLSPSARRGVRGWLFLARLSEALQPVEVDQEKYDDRSMGERKQETGDRSQKTVGAADREGVLAGEAGR